MSSENQTVWFAPVGIQADKANGIHVGLLHAMHAAPAMAQVQTSDAIDANGSRPIYRLDVDAREDVVRKNGEFVEAGNEAQDAERVLDESKRGRAAASECKHGLYEEISLRGAQRSQLRSAYQRELDPA